MTVATNIRTAEQLLNSGDIGRCELVRGELIMMSPSGFRHAAVAAAVAQILRNHVAPNRLGVVTGAEGGFIIEREPDTVRAPDAAFVRSKRVSSVLSTSYFPGAPDLAVEVLSPNDAATDVLAKVRDWLAAGATAVWIVDPARKTITIHRSDDTTHTYGDADELASEPPLPDLRFPVRDVFA